MTTHWHDKPVTILGLSATGMATAEYLSQHGARCFLSETMPASPLNEARRQQLEALGVAIETGGHSAQCFTHSPLAVVSPGIPPTAHVLNELRISGVDTISDVELAYRETDTPFVAVTGTNGKTTVVSLISAILQSAGKAAPPCGNIGIPIMSVLQNPADYLVAELSSAQLTFSPTLTASVAVFTNFKPDHLDWHGSLASYKQAKLRLFTGTQSPKWAVLNAHDPISQDVMSNTTAQIFWFSTQPDTVQDKPNAITLDTDGTIVTRQNNADFSPLMPVSDIALVGTHNHDNVLAAIATALILDVPQESIIQAVSQFKNLEHRLEPVATIQGVTYYNDSKATNVDAAISALQALSSQVVLIAGGKDKGSPLDEFVAMVKTHAAHVILIGMAAERFSQALSSAGYTNLTFADTLEEATQKAAQLASPDTPVLLSPACASFGMYKNFEERGHAFKRVVHELEQSVGSPS